MYIVEMTSKVTLVLFLLFCCCCCCCCSFSIAAVLVLGSSSSSSLSSLLSSKKTTKWLPLTTNSGDPFEKQARDCTAQGAVYTAGKNDAFAGCNDAWCCLPSQDAWEDGKKTNELNWMPGNVNTSDPYDKQARDCTAEGGVYTGGQDDAFPGCNGAWCCQIAK